MILNIERIIGQAINEQPFNVAKVVVSKEVKKELEAAEVGEYLAGNVQVLASGNLPLLGIEFIPE